jgi:F-type H+-transporting ATPase subunit a
MTKRDRYIYLGAILALLTVWGLMMVNMEADVSRVGEPPQKLSEIFGWKIPLNGINIPTILNTWLVMALMILAAYAAKRRLKKIPDRFQAGLESIVQAFDELCRDTLGDELGRKFMPFVATIFLFVLFSNWITIVPIQGLEEPTRDLNTTLGLGLICAGVAHASGIRVKGWKKYLEGYIEPGGVIGWIMLPMNIVGEVAKVGSHSIRLFGNILGGAVLIMVIAILTRQLLIFNVGLQFFFGLFVGLIQAFVFAMLALAYISVKVT